MYTHITCTSKTPPNRGTVAMALLRLSNEKMSTPFSSFYVVVYLHVHRRLFILLFSNQGVSRSGAICVAYLMRTKMLTFKDALAHLKLSKPDVWFWDPLLKIVLYCILFYSNMTKSDVARMHVCVHIILNVSFFASVIVSVNLDALFFLRFVSHLLCPPDWFYGIGQSKRRICETTTRVANHGVIIFSLQVHSLVRMCISILILFTGKSCVKQYK